MTPLSKFTATGPNAKFLQHLNRVIDRLNALDSTSNPDEFITKTTTGVIRKSKKKNTTSESTPAQQMRVKSVHDNHLVCTRYNGATDGAELISVALPYELRRSTYDGQTVTIIANTTVGHTYTYLEAQKRRDRASSKNWSQRIHPSYALNDIIYAVEVEQGTSVTDLEDNPVTFVDLNVCAREWATEIPVCDEGVTKTMLAVGSAPQ